jgi:hypothetical protein
MIVTQMLCVKLTDEDYEVIELIFSDHSKSKQNLARILYLVTEYNFLELRDPFREYWSFEPKMEIQKVWTDIQKIPPKRFIGVGYNDHGTLSTAPSWKDQLSDDGEVSHPANLLKFHLEYLLRSPLSRNSSSKGSFRLTSSKRAK